MSKEDLQKQIIGFLNTPPIWVNKQFDIQQFDFPAIDLRQFKAKPILKKIRLGHQMEYVFNQLIDYSETYKVLLHNLPIRQGKQTLGEIDFILKDLATDKLVHVELTYKFYIINPKITVPIRRLIGPNKRDMFFAKMEKIKNQQFQLLHSKEGSKALLDNEINHNKVNHQACYKAQLFVPFGHVGVNIYPLNIDCICGYWLRFDNFNTTPFKAHQFYIPIKSEWVIAPHDNVQWHNHFEIQMEINLRVLKENAPMVWMKKSDTEFEKFFVVWW